MTEQNQAKTFRERQKEQRLPIQFALYKGVSGKFGALRLNLKKAYMDDRRDKDDGCVFLEMAPAVGPNNYDWENGKITMALGISDIPKIILFLQAPGHSTFSKSDGKLKLYHDKGAGTASKGQDTTNLTIEKPADYDNFFVSVYQKRGDSVREAKVSVSQDEAIAMGILLREAIPQILAWN